MPAQLPVERVVFGQSMEGLYRALHPLTPQERAAFLKAGITGEKFQSAYPLEQYMDIQAASAASRFAHLPEFDRYVQLGTLFIAGFEKTLLGSAMLAMVKVLGPRRALERITRNFRTGNNFTEGTLSPVGPTHYRLTINPTLRPGFFHGVLCASFAKTGAAQGKVVLAESKNETTTWDISWK